MNLSLPEFIYETLTDIEAHINRMKTARFRILVDEKGLKYLKRELNGRPSNRFSIVCRRLSEPTQDPANGIFGWNTDLFNHTNVTLFRRFIEKNWFVNWSQIDEEIMLQQPAIFFMGDEEVEQLINENTGRINLIPYKIKEFAEPSENVYRLWFEEQPSITGLDLSIDEEKVDNEGSLCLTTLSRIIHGRPIFDDYRFRPIIEYKKYLGEKELKLDQDFDLPENFSRFMERLLKDNGNPLFISGFGKGTDYLAVQMLKKAAIIDGSPNIFEIKVYSKSNFEEFVADFDSNQLHSCSVVLRDVFDPFFQSYDDQNCPNHFYDKELKDPVKPEEEKAGEGVRYVTGKKLWEDPVMSKLMHDGMKLLKRIVHFFDKKHGNYLIITSQFESDSSLQTFYQGFPDNVQNSQNLKVILNGFVKIAFDYDSGFAGNFFDQMVEHLNCVAEFDIGENAMETLRGSFDSFVKIDNVFRIALARIFKRFTIKLMAEMRINREFDNAMLSEFTAKIAKFTHERRKKVTEFFEYIHMKVQHNGND